MALDDYLDSEVAIAMAATAALLSPRVRGVLRKGAVYGLAGAFAAADTVGSFARGIGRGAQGAAAGTVGTAAGASMGPTTPEEAADALAAASGAADGVQGGARKGRRTRSEQAEGAIDE